MCCFEQTSWRPFPDLFQRTRFSALRGNPAMLKHHLDSIGPQAERRRGQIDPHLAVARAKIDDAETFDEAVGYLTARETVAVLNDRSTLERLMTTAPCIAAKSRVTQLIL